MSRILVIDDEESIRGLLRTVLTRKGHKVFLADGGRKGIALFERICPAVAIVDLRMPDLSGPDVVRSLRAFDPQACIIVLTGFGTSETEAQARALGVKDFLKKGFSLFELGEALRRVLDRKTGESFFQQV